MLPRFYFPGEISVGQLIDLSADTAHHAARVLRLEEGAEVVLFNGKGGEFQSVIVRGRRSGATVAVEQYRPIERESSLSITLAQAVCASDKMDWIVQKAVELGVDRVQPLVTARSVVRLSGERGERRVSHLQKVAIAAAEQCGRNRILQVFGLASLEGWLGVQAAGVPDSSKETSLNTRLILMPGAKMGLRDLSAPPAGTGIVLLVGPEGGFAPNEESAAKVAGFTPIRLGERILRVESAALAAVAAMQALWGDY